MDVQLITTDFTCNANPGTRSYVYFNCNTYTATVSLQRKEVKGMGISSLTSWCPQSWWPSWPRPLYTPHPAPRPINGRDKWNWLISCQTEYPMQIEAHLLWVQWNISTVDTLGTLRSVLIERCPHFRGIFTWKQHIWDIAKCPQYRDVLISEVSLRRVPLWLATRCILCCCCSYTVGQSHYTLATGNTSVSTYLRWLCDALLIVQQGVGIVPSEEGREESARSPSRDYTVLTRYILNLNSIYTITVVTI